MEIYVIAAVCLFSAVVNGVIVKFFLSFCTHLQAQLKQREGEYFKIIRDLHNRLTAKDISGYMTLKDVTETQSFEPRFKPRSDEVEADIFRQNAGLD